MKQMFAAAGLPQARVPRVPRRPRPRRVRRRGWTPSSGCPCFVKPANMGSSVGVSKAHDRAELDAAIDARARVRRVDPRRGDGRRPRDRGRGARRRSAGGVAAGRGRARAPSSTPTPTSTRTARPSCSRPRRCPRRRRRGAHARGARVRGVPVRGDGAGRLLLRGERPRLPRERAEHDPRLHADLDVPEAVGGQRAAVRRSCSTASSTSRSSATPAARTAPAASADRP